MRRIEMKSVLLCAVLLIVLVPATARPQDRWFNTLVAHWTDYGDPDYLHFLQEARPEIAQVGFYGVTYYSLVHTEFGKGYPAHMPVQGVKEGGAFFQNLNREIHKRQVKVVGHFNTTFIFGDPVKNTGFFHWYNDLWDEKLLGSKPARAPVEMLQVDAAGKPITTASYGIGGWLEYHGCLNNPKWRACLKPMVSTAIQRGVDGLIANYFYRRDCMCQYCQDGFRAYLAAHYTAEQLREQMGITDIKTHRFTEIVSWHDPSQSDRPNTHTMPTGSTSSIINTAKTNAYRMAALTWTQISLKQAYDDVFIHYGRKLKPDLMVAQWNHLGDFNQINGDERSALPGDLWGRGEDYLWYSTGNAHSQTDLAKGDLGDGTLQLRYIRGAFGAKPYLLGKYESTRTRVTIAEGVANGGTGLGFYAPFKNPVGRAGLTSYFGFLRRNRQYYQGAIPAGELLLLYPRSAVHNGDVAPVARFRALGKRLLRDHYAFDVLPDDLLTTARLRSYRAVAYCDEESLNAAARQSLASFTGPRLLMKTAELPADIGEWSSKQLAGFTRIEGSPTIILSLMSQPQSKRMIVHLVNYNRIEPPAGVAPAGRGPQDEQPVACENTRVQLRVLPGRRVKSVRLLSPDEGMASPTLPVEQQPGLVTFTVPKMLVYSLAVVQFHFSMAPEPVKTPRP